jgi:hypothetical protein
MQDRLVEALGRVARHLTISGNEREASMIQDLARGVTNPCVVAVVGRVKAGKSALINALLKEDLAKVGISETTATINRFSFGYPDADRPIRCHWRRGGVTSVDRAFVDGLQGNDLETLRRAEAVEYLEYVLPNQFLQQVTLVDTPGTGAVVEEHQNRTAEYLRLYGQLRNLHDKETERLSRDADAVIYLVGPVAMHGDLRILDEFLNVIRSDTRPLNAIGVISKIDLFPELLTNREEVARRLSVQLKNRVNTVIPASAGIRRALDSGEANWLSQLRDALRRVPAGRLEMLLDSDDFYLGSEFEDCPVSCAQRRALLGDLEWGVFKAIARVAANGALSTEAVRTEIDGLSGFAPLLRTLRQHFFERAQILRCYRIIEDVRRLLRELRLERLPRIRKDEIDNQGRLARFMRFLDQAGGDPGVAEELRESLRSFFQVSGRADSLARLLAAADDEIRACRDKLIEVNADFAALQAMEEGLSDFTEPELDELRSLFGLYGPDHVGLNRDYVVGRQLAWHRSEFEATPGTARHLVAMRAYARYGLLLATTRAAHQRDGSHG